MLSTVSFDHCEVANQIARQTQRICAIGRTDSLQLRTATCEKQRVVARVLRQTRM